MLNQSFSHENLFKIYVKENRKGNDLAVRFFPEVIEKHKKIKKAKDLIRAMYSRKVNSKSDYFKERISLTYRIIRKIKQEKNELIRQKLEEISNKISQKNYRLQIRKGPTRVNNKDVFVVDNSPESFFAEKQIQRNIKKTFNVKQKNRDLIIPQIRSLLDDSFQKYFIKTDIKEFYESIDSSHMKRKINQNSSLNIATKKIITKLLKDYESLTGENKGIPRGIGISAYLAELYMKDFDDYINSLEGVLYYARYVDDIVLITTPSLGKDPGFYLNVIKDFLKSQNLEIHESEKTLAKDTKKDKNFEFEYLGYKFNKNKGKTTLTISNKRLNKYKTRIKNILIQYEKNSKKQPKKSKSELFIRLKFLTTNSRLSNNKGNAFIGVYNSNKWVTDSKFTKILDGFLKGEASRRIKDKKLRNRVFKFSFKESFDNRRFTNFGEKEYRIIGGIWKS